LGRGGSALSSHEIDEGEAMKSTNVCQLLFVLIFILSCALFASEETTPFTQARALFSSFEAEGTAIDEQKTKEVSLLVQQLTQQMPSYPSGQYLSILGDGHYYLGHIGEALYFWRRAELKLPPSQGLEKRVALARSLLDLEKPALERPFVDAIGLSFLPRTMKYTLLLLSAAASFFVWTVWQFFRVPLFTYVFGLFVTLSLLLLGCVTWYEWFSPPLVMVLRGTELRGSLDVTSRQAYTTYFLQTGEEAEVESSSPDKKWLRIRTAGNQRGYVHGSAVGFLE
jgi:magnesium-transporting ATPase (P-type)